VRRLKAAISDARPHVARLVEEATAGSLRNHFTVDDLRSWRLNSTRLLAGSKIVYDAWMRSLVLEALDFSVAIIVMACRYPPDSQDARRTQEVLEAWARDRGVLTDSYRMLEGIRDNVDLPEFAQMILNFGLVYKKRRLHFVLHEINNFYPARFTKSGGGESESLDLLKLKIRKCLDDLAVYDDIGFLSLPAVAACRALFMGGPGGRRPNIASGNVAALTAEDFDEITRLLDRLGLEGDLARGLDNVDAVLASPLVQGMAEECRCAILTGYLGYMYWDIIMRPVASALSLNEGPIESILVDRISPEDAPTLRLEEGGKMLQGGALASFGGFLGRAIRENDYLWGRLHAVDRLLDILVSTVPRNLALEVDLRALKKRAFQCVLAEEREQLQHSADLIARLEDMVERL
ncbi:MAG TPA: DUF3376 domain-containing protein, partial [Ramlibacter sp.]|nr:DUF3376 domain-containing protein [Ramlibacter sp.]